MRLTGWQKWCEQRFRTPRCYIEKHGSQINLRGSTTRESRQFHRAIPNGRL
jgi:hypothetical protein